MTAIRQEWHGKWAGWLAAAASAAVWCRLAGVEPGAAGCGTSAGIWLAWMEHAGTALLLGWLAWRATGRWFLGLAAGCLMMVHPLGVEDVAVGNEGTTGRWFLMVAILSLEWWRAMRREGKRGWKPWAVAAFGALLAVFAAVGLVRSGAALGGGAVDEASARSDAPAWWFRGLRYLAIPWPLNVAPAAPSGGEWAGAFWLAALVWMAWALRKAAPEASVGLGWIVAAGLCVSGLFWRMERPGAESLLAWMVPGFAVAVGFVLDRQGPGKARWWGLWLLLATYGALTWMRLGQWESGEKLWAAAALQNPGSAAALERLAVLRESAGDAEGAAQFREAARRVAGGEDVTGEAAGTTVEGMSKDEEMR